jgi:type I restriction-modification system DNA methylase subunit
MNRDEAARLIKETFDNPFDEDRFRLFSKNLFNDLDESKAFAYHGQYIPDAFKDHIRQYKRIGKYTDPDQSELDVLVVHLKKETSLERARTMQRNFVANYLKSRGEKDAAIVAFCTDGLEDWRFSFVRMDYRTIQTESGKVKVKEDLTPARRYSFLVGSNEPNHTAQQQLVPILEDDRDNTTLADIEHAFNIESVTKEFFNRYKDLFLKVKEELNNVVAADRKIKAEFESRHIDTANFAKKLLGQIVFLYFIQKKGWLGVERDKTWGRGPRNFLRKLFDKEIVSYENFFNDILEPLFYEALAIDRGEVSFYSRFNCKIPFLNGGLFEPINGYNWEETDILLKNDTFREIFDTFDLYNFTVREDEPLEREVAVDPEMLGKVFENLLEVKDRKSKGTYYTPREIVHYMCQESLINYLDTTINTQEETVVPQKPVQKSLIGEDKPEQAVLTVQAHKVVIPRENIEAFIRRGDFAINNDLAKEQGTKSYTYKMPESIRNNAELFDEKLAAIKICDPAIGSGAFPVGMMHEIVRARETLTTYIGESKSRMPYNFKRHAIQESIYGVDIDPGAVDIAKLRLWLSLVVDEDDFKTIKPLPNLDYKIICGDSLSSVNTLFHHAELKKLEKLKARYFEETRPREKTRVKEEIDALIRAITNNDEHFDFKVYFSEIFHGGGGFNVVIGNPPYVFGGSKKILKDDKNFYRAIYKSGSNKINLFALFIEQGSYQLKNDGVLTYIVPNTLLRVTSYSNIRAYILQNMVINEIVDLDVGVFDGVTASTIIISLKKTKSNNDTYTSIKRGLSLLPDNIINQKEFNNKGCIFDIFSKDVDRMLINKLFSNSIKLGQIAKRIRFGVVISGNIKDLVSKTKSSAQWKPFLEGDEIGSYSIKHSGRYLYYKKELLHRSRTPDIFETDKILIQRITGGSRPIKAAYDVHKFYNKESIINMILENRNAKDYKYVLSVLNSQLINWFYKNKFTNESKLTVNLSKEYLSEIPIKLISAEGKNQIVQIVDQILSLKNQNPDTDTTSLEHNIDKIMYEIYELTPEEIEIVEGKT